MPRISIGLRVCVCCECANAPGPAAATTTTTEQCTATDVLTSDSLALFRTNHKRKQASGELKPTNNGYKLSGTPFECLCVCCDVFCAVKGQPILQMLLNARVLQSLFFTFLLVWEFLQSARRRRRRGETGFSCCCSVACCRHFDTWSNMNEHAHSSHWYHSMVYAVAARIFALFAYA